MTPVVTAIVPALNAMCYIGTALELLLSQTLNELEVIVVDNGSTDATLEIVRHFERRDARVRSAVYSDVRGAAAARNVGLNLARGHWVAPVDADDACAPARFAHLVAAAECQGADLVADNVAIVSFPDRQQLDVALAADSGLFGRSLTLPEFLQRDAPNRFAFGQLKPLIRREFLLAHDIRYRNNVAVGEDFALYVDCLLCGARFQLLKEAMYFYAVRPGSLSWASYSIQAALELNGSYLGNSLVCSRPAWRAAFERRGAKLQQQLTYRAFAQALKTGRLATAARSFKDICGHPGLLTAQLYSAVCRRIFGERSPFRGQIR